jgi:Lrp/AsnC family transcriptional regulator for asnA, asnC and gidA
VGSIKLDKKDIDLIHAISENARSSYSKLAKKTGLSRELVTYRLNKLVEKGVFESFVALPKLQNMGYLVHVIYLRFGKISGEKEKSVIAQLAKESHISWVATTGGTYDLALCLFSKSLQEFDKALSSALSILGDSVKSYVILNSMDEGVLPANFFGGKIHAEPSLLPSKTLAVGATHDVKLDDKDKKILSRLCHDARANLVAIAQELNIPANTVSHRIKRLVKSGAISNFVAVPGYEKLGLQWNIVLLRLTNLSPEMESKFFYYIKQHPFIDYYVKHVGVWNYQLSVITKDPSHLRQILLELKSNFGDLIQEHETITVFEQHKYLNCVV